MLLADRSCHDQEHLNGRFLNGLFFSGFSRGKTAPEDEFGERPIKVRKRAIAERKRPIKAEVLVGVSASCLMGCFGGTHHSEKA